MASFLNAQEMNTETIEKLIKSLSKKIDLDQNCLDCYYQRAQLYVFFRDENNLKLDIEQLKKLDKEGWRYHHICGLFEMMLGDHVSAIEHYKKARSQNKDKSDILLQYAQLEILEGNIEVAKPILEDYKEELKKELDDCNYNLAGANFWGKKFKEAYSNIVEIKKKDSSSIRLEGKILIELGEFTKGIKILNDLFIKNPDDKELNFIIIKYYISNEKLKEAKSLLSQVIKNDPLNDINYNMFLIQNPGDEKLILKITKYYIKNKDIIEAKYLLNKLIEKNPFDEDAKTLLSEIK